MNYLNFTKYIYLIISLFLAWDAFSKWNDGTDNFWLSAILSAASLFTFFFRMKFSKKFADRKKNTTDTNK